MAAKTRSTYICSNCGYETIKWYGKCPDCGEWNTFEESVLQPVKNNGQARAKRSAPAGLGLSRLSEINSGDEHRYKTGLAEFDNVLGGGIVRGSVVLLGGEPGIGKSTLLLQVCQSLGQTLKIIYVSGEESRAQLKLRADRLGVDTENLTILSETDIENTVDVITANRPDIVIIDSIQTMNSQDISSASGSVSQVKECTQQLARCAKSEDISIFIVGHVNKDGAIAGPKVLEHIVDAVLYFEGEKNQFYRILRAAKNRYGSTNEIGVFEMQASGLAEVKNPSMLLLADRPTGVSGTCVACVMEGSRPIMAEAQALVSKSGFPTPRRMSTGFDYNRMSLILAVIEKRGGVFFGNLDCYVNVVGGLKLEEPAADLAVAIAIISSLTDKPMESLALAFGEVGLAGEIRSVPSVEKRISEAIKLGFKKCILPRAALKGIDAKKYPIELIGVRSINELFSVVG